MSLRSLGRFHIHFGLRAAECYPAWHCFVKYEPSYSGTRHHRAVGRILRPGTRDLNSNAGLAVYNHERLTARDNEIVRLRLPTYQTKMRAQNAVLLSTVVGLSTALRGPTADLGYVKYVGVNNDALG